MNKIYFTKFLVIIAIFNIFALNAQQRKYSPKELISIAKRNFSTKIYLIDNSDLTYLILNKEFDFAKELIEYTNGNIDTQNIFGITPLMVAAAMNNLELVEIIINCSKYQDISGKLKDVPETHDCDGRTAYDHAILNENYKLAEILKNLYGIKSGINLD